MFIERETQKHSSLRGVERKVGVQRLLSLERPRSIALRWSSGPGFSVGSINIGLLRSQLRNTTLMRGFETLEETKMTTRDTDNSPTFDRRPWGTFTVLDEADGFKVKRIEVLPGKRLSYQKHAQRAEHWFVVEGTAKVTLDGSEHIVEAGRAIDIPKGAAHRVENPGETNLVFIEVQRGGYLGEDDIVRLEDDFGRAAEK